MSALDVTKILRSYGAELCFEESVSLEPMRMLGESVEFPEPLAVQGIITNQGENFRLKASISGTLSAMCSMCGDALTEPIALEIEETLIHHPNRRKGGQDKAEADFMYEAEREGAFVFTTHMLDLEKIIGDHVFLNLPSQFFCKADCKGLCPICGKNRNKEECECSNSLL